MIERLKSEHIIFDSKLVQVEVNLKNRIFYICGPPAMIEAMKKTLD